VRRTRPAQWRLRNRLRYVLEHDPLLAVWKDAHGCWVCGYAAWRGRADRGQLPAEHSVLDVGPQHPRVLLTRLFDAGQAPLELARVVDLAASVWRVPPVDVDDTIELERVRDPHPAADVEIECRRKAAETWAHIRDLPLRQRQALLLNLKGDAVSLFLTTGTASLREMAVTLEMNVEGLASLWSDLPLSDNQIASRLACTRQQVINLRMAARKRLANRLAGWS
jgi:hypothetical protein